MDEKGLTPHYAPPKVLHNRAHPPPEVTPPKGTLTTIIGCGNALGTQIPPYFVFQGVNFHQRYTSKSTQGTQGTVSDSGWSNSRVFQKYLKEHFLKNIPRPTREEPALLIYDGHKSHVNLQLIQWALDNNIVLFLIPAHTSHILQPLDLACFRPLEASFVRRKHEMMKHHRGGQLGHETMCELGCLSYQESMKTSNLCSGFRKAGIFPFRGIEAVDKVQLTPSVPFAQRATETEMEQDTTTQANPPVQVEPPTDQDTLICGTCKSTFHVLQDFINHKETPCVAPQHAAFDPSQDLFSQPDFFEARTVSKAPSASKQRNDIGSITGGRELTSRPVRDAVRAHCKSRKTTQKKTFDTQEHCCVCERDMPPLPMLDEEFRQENFDWVECDQCGHWVHTGFCVAPLNTDDTDSMFFCPCCYSEE